VKAQADQSIHAASVIQLKAMVLKALALKANTRKLIAFAAITLNVVAFQNCSGSLSGGFQPMSRVANAAALASTANSSNSSALGDGSATPTPAPTPISCLTPRHYKFDLPPNTALKCQSYVVLGAFPVKDEGFAVARANIVVKNSGGYYARNETFRAQTVVGDMLIAPASGGDVPSGNTTQSEGVLGYGHLSSSNNNVVINATSQGVNCMDNQLSIVSGSVDVWVEDDQTSCQGRDIVVASTTNTLTNQIFNWSDSGDDILSLRANLPQNRANALVLSHSEASVEPSATCSGWAAPEITAQAFLEGAALSSAQQTLVTNNQLSSLNRGFLSTSDTQTVSDPVVTASLMVSSTVVNSSGFSGPFPTHSGNKAHYYGDSVLALIFQ
jgi:hypothetical protein